MLNCIGRFFVVHSNWLLAISLWLCVLASSYCWPANSIRMPARAMLMHEIEKGIQEAAERQFIKIRKLPRDEATGVLRELMRRYIKDPNPHSLALWMDLAKPIDEYYDRNSVKFVDVVPQKSGACWLIPETDSADELELPVYEIDISEIEKLINDCFSFEYNVVANDLSWLVIETHHDQYYVCRDSDFLPNLMSK